MASENELFKQYCDMADEAHGTSSKPQFAVSVTVLNIGLNGKMGS